MDYGHCKSAEISEKSGKFTLLHILIRVKHILTITEPYSKPSVVENVELEHGLDLTVSASSLSCRFLFNIITYHVLIICSQGKFVHEKFIQLMNSTTHRW